MNLSGTFRTTRFSDVLRYYAISKDSATLRVWLAPGKKDPDGTFEFVNGQLMEASLEGFQGKEAIRRALTLREGSFAAGEREAPGTSEDLALAVEIPVEPEIEPARPPLPAPPITLTPLMNPLPAVPPARRAVASAAASPAVAVALAPTLFTEVPARADPSPALPPLPVQRVPPPVEERAPASAEERVPGAELPAMETAAAPADAPPPAAVPFADGTERTKARRLQLLLVAGAVGIVAVIAAVAVPARERLSQAAPARSGEGAPAVAAPTDDTNAPAKPTAAPAAAPRGVLPDTLVLGMVSSFTGSNKERGRAMRIGWEMAIGEANEAGGIHGRKLRLVSQDDGYDPKRTLAGMKAVIEEASAFAIVGNVGTATAAVAIPYAGQQQAVFFGALSGGDLLRKTPPDRHVFNFRASLAREGEAAVRYLVDVRRTKPQRIAVVAQDDEFGASGRDGALRQLAAYGIRTGDVLSLSYPRNTTNVREALAELRAKRANVDAVVMVATYKPAATLVRKSRDAGLGFFFTTVSADSNGLAEELVEAGERYTRGVLVTQVVPVPTSHATTLVRYRQALEKYAPGEKPGSTSLEAWLGAQVFLEGVRRAGRELDTPRLIAALESVRDWDIGIGGNITFGPNDHQGCDVVWGWMLQPDGTYRQVDLE